MPLSLPDPALILLIGPAASGKSSFASRNFQPTEIVSSDHCRALIADCEADQQVTADAFDLLRFVVRKRLRHHKLTVVDATNLRADSRARLLWLAFQFEVPAIGIIFDFDEQLCLSQNDKRSTRVVPANIIQEQFAALRSALPTLPTEGFAATYTIQTPEQLSQTTITRIPTPRDNSALPL